MTPDIAAYLTVGLLALSLPALAFFLFDPTPVFQTVLEGEEEDQCDES